jgi:outer membrane lipoprotein SlyB
MKMTNFSQKMIAASAMSILVFGLSGCETMNQPGYSYDQSPAYRQSSNSRDSYSMYGIVQSIELVRQDRAGSTIGLGTIAGAVVGGIVGNQIGSGKGNTAATVVGAAGGAYVGHELENRNQQQADAYRVTVRMEDGSNQTLMQDTSGDIRVGDRVRIENGVARRY